MAKKYKVKWRLNMNRIDLYRGKKVFHCTFPHFGEGEVIDVRDKDFFGYRTSKKYKVRWSNGKEIWQKASELRKTFNHKKADLIREIKNNYKNEQGVENEQ